MTVAAIEKKAKLITGRDGRPVEVILPYGIYKELLELERSMEIFKRKETQESIKRAKEDARQGRVKTFCDVKAAVKWLDK
ncbi:hypothetical protein [Dissulfurispira sp.]|uniref:hypothetical protein n=1 Tax=Dissulfurispira sp. TaxID=2817609 RepID=UPI002FD95D89